MDFTGFYTETGKTPENFEQEKETLAILCADLKTVTVKTGHIFIDLRKKRKIFVEKEH